MIWKLIGIGFVLCGGGIIAYCASTGAFRTLANIYGCSCLALGVVFFFLLGRKKKTRVTPASERLSVVDALCEALNEKDWYGRYYAATLAMELGPEAKGAVPRLLELLKDEHEWVREAASKALDSIDPEAKTARGQRDTAERERSPWRRDVVES